VVKIFQLYQKVGKDVLKACIDHLYDFPKAAQMEIFNLPEELRDELLLLYAKYTSGSERISDAALVKILDLPHETMMKIITIYLKCGNCLSKEAELKIMNLGKDVAEKIFSIYHHFPEADTFDVVFHNWDAASKKKFFLTYIKKICGYELRNHYDTVERIVDLTLKFPANDRDELLVAFFDRGYMDDNIFKKICSTVEDPSRKHLLMSKIYSTSAIDVLLELPEPTRTEVLIHQIEEADYCNFTGSQLKKFFEFPEPYRSRVLMAYVKRYDDLFYNVPEEVLEMPEPLRTELVLNSIYSLARDNFFELPEPLRTEALCAYMASEEADDNDIFMVYDLPDESRTAILLATIKAKKKMNLFDYGPWSSPLKERLFYLPEPSRTEVITAYVENGWELDEPMMLWLLPKKTRTPLIEKYAKLHKDFSPAQYEKEINELLGEIPD
jgi:hypothetical protein